MKLMNVFRQQEIPFTLRDYRLSVEDDIDAGLPIKILKTNKEALVIEDNTCCDNRVIKITNPSLINENWIKEKITVSPSVSDLKYELDIDEIANYLIRNVNHHYLLTLEGVAFCNDTLKDKKYLSDQDNGYRISSKINALPKNGCIGTLWSDSNRILINVGEIVNLVNQMAEEHKIEDWEKVDVINEEIGLSILYEIRCLAQSNPYIPEEIFNQKYMDISDDAEHYAKEIYSKCKSYAMVDKDETDKDYLLHIENVEL